MKERIYVVEGKHDESHLKNIFNNIKVVTTNGSAIPIETINLIKELENNFEIVLFLDPDNAGEKIRRVLTKELKSPIQAFLNPNIARSKNNKKIGIEHASEEDIKKSLNHLAIPFSSQISDIDYHFLYINEIIGNHNSKKNREKICSYFCIDHVNGKTLFERLKWLNIMQAQILEVLK